MTTYAACLTPPGTGAIAVLAVRGELARETVAKLFQASGGRQPPVAAEKGGLTPPARQRLPEPGRFWLGRFGDDAADECVLTVQRLEPTPWLELHCHGGVLVVRFLLEMLEKQGVQVVPWQELERLTTADPLRTEAANALTAAVTARTAAILLDQYHGAFDLARQTLLTALERRDLAAAGLLLDELARWTSLGRHLTTPWRVVVAGAPNVGKSSLVNALAGFQRCVVAPTPGTTRDVVTTVIAVEGWAIEIADTAGLREATDLEGQGIDRARAALAATDVGLWVLDAATEPTWPTEPGGRLHFVINKTDLPAAWDVGRAGEAIGVSAKTGAGVAELAQALVRWLVPEVPQSGAAVPFTDAWCTRLDEARRLFHGGQAAAIPRLLGVISPV